MITIIAQVCIQSMKRISLSIVLLLIATQARLSAQETAAGGQQAAPSGPVPTNQPSGLLTPPPDNAPAAAPAALPETAHSCGGRHRNYYSDYDHRDDTGPESRDIHLDENDFA